MKTLVCMLSVCVLLCLILWTGAAAEPFHIGLVTGSEDQAMDELLGAKAFQEKYGEDCVLIRNYPDSFTTEREKTVQIITELADDPAMKAIIVNQGIPGTAEAFRQIKEHHPDILCITGQTHEDLAVIRDAADLVIKSNAIIRGYTIIYTAHMLGCDTFVHISFPRHRASETLGRRLAIMRAACEEFGMTFAEETAPDPTISGTSVAQAFMMMEVPEWISRYGQNAAYFCTNDAHTEPLLRQLLSYGGYFVEADLPSPMKGYPQALGIDISGKENNCAEVLSMVEEAVCAKGGAGRFGTWTYSFGYTLSAGLAQHAHNVIEKKSELNNLDDILAAFREYAPDAKWKGTNYGDPGVVSPNVFWLYEDTYIMGAPGYYVGTTELEMPESYYSIRQ